MPITSDEIWTPTKVKPWTGAYRAFNNPTGKTLASDFGNWGLCE
jgi:hypothetical protein